MIIFPEFKDIVRDIEEIKQKIEKQLYINTVSLEPSNTSISLEVKIDPNKTFTTTYNQEIVYVREELEKLLEKLEKEEKINTRVKKEIIF
jgi:adenine-specific DNA methylase